MIYFQLGDDCLLTGLLSLVHLNFGPTLRWRLREKHGIAGSMIMDVLVHTVCGPCALFQEGKQYGLGAPAKVEDIGRE